MSRRAPYKGLAVAIAFIGSVGVVLSLVALLICFVDLAFTTTSIGFFFRAVGASIGFFVVMLVFGLAWWFRISDRQEENRERS